MNERIKELAKQAGAEFYEGFAGSPNSVKFMEEDFKKFAELIVQKCADIGQQYADGNYEVYNQILAHFGLEEE